MNSSGVLQASYKYNPYGGLISSSGTLAGANTMRFSSKPAILSATGAWGFYYYGYRFYDPGMQRWLNRDPIQEWGGINVYSLSKQSPLSLIDPYGLDIRFCKDATADFIRMIQACICELRKSSRGRELLAMAEETGGVTICAGSGPQAGIDRSGLTVAQITMYPLSAHGVPPGYADDMKDCEYPPNSVKGCAAVLGHELGHAMTGAQDEGEVGQGRNVRENENAIRRELGLPERCAYHEAPLNDEEQQ
jgi:RHS repeat-associated protein